MARVRSRGNAATELRLIKLFKKFGITGWRRNQKLFGKPDFVFSKAQVAVFVDGCFWHGCTRHKRQPKTNRAFWKNKIARNKGRDRLVNRTLRQRGWNTLRIWQHELRSRNESRLLLRLLRVLR